PVRYGLWVPFLDAAVNHLLHAQAQVHNFTAGEPLRWQPPEKDATRSFVVVRPDGQRVALGPPDSERGRPGGTVADTARAGPHPTAPADGKAGEGVPFAVGPDLGESADLAALTDAELDELLGFRPHHLTAGDDPGAFAGTERLNREWTLWLLAAV